jgi:serine/threonine protein phosphatase 1
VVLFRARSSDPPNRAQPQTSERSPLVWRLFTKSERRRPTLPKGLRIYAIGDVHGRADLLDRVLSRIDGDLTASPVSRSMQVFLGDYIDRGPASREVLDRLIERGRSSPTVFLKGNHEAFVSSFLQNPGVLGEWRRFGGLETLISYGLRPSVNPDSTEQAELAGALKSAIPNTHLFFLRTLRTSYTCGDFFFVHAGVRPGVPLARQRHDDLLWIREEFLLHEGDFGKVIVHGHTPVPQPEIRPNRINIDTGAYATGRLTCLKIEAEQTMVLES